MKNLAGITVLIFVFFPFTSQAQRFTDFRFQRVATGLNYTFTGEIDHDTRTITVKSERDRTQGWIENIDRLAATFSLDGNYEVKVGETAQISGTTPNDFRRAVVYTINGNVDYTVILEHPQASGLPVIRIDTEKAAPINDRETWINTTFSLTDPDNPENNVAKTDFRDQIRGRGNSTWAYNKKPYRIRFRNETSLFGLPAARNWVLLAEYLDATLMKNAAVFALGNILGVPYTNTYHHVQLYLNGSYRGVYGLTEHRQADPLGVGAPGRVKIDLNEGWLVELDRLYDEEPKFRTRSYNLPVLIKSPDFSPADMTNPAYEFIRTDLNELCAAVASRHFPENGYRDLIDMDIFIRYIMTVTIIGYSDFNIPGSVFMYKDKGGKITLGPLWDYDTTFGFSWESVPLYTTNSPVAGIVSGYPPTRFPIPHNEFFNRFFQDPVFRAKWKEFWNANRSEIMTLIPQFIENTTNTISKGAKENFKLWWTSYRDRGESIYIPVDHNKQVGDMLDYFYARVAYLDEEYQKMEGLTNDLLPEENPDNTLRAWVRNGLLHVTGLSPGEILSVYTITGALVYQKIATSDEADIPLSVQGVYVVLSGNNTVKVVFL